MMNKKLLLAAVLLGVLVLGLISQKFYRSSFEYAGTIEATRIDLPSRVATVVKAIHVDEGDRVKEGDLLVDLACEDIALAAALAKENFLRAEQLKKTDSVSKEGYESARNKFQEAETRLSWCQIKSPVSGVILTKFLEVSEWTNPGSKILSVADVDHPWAYFYVSQETMAQLKVGTEVAGLIPELKKSFQGRVVKINDQAEFTPKNIQTRSERTRLVFGIKVAFNNEDQSLKPGMTIVSTLTDQ